ncbi:Splicing factor 45 [Coemansia aciculifera]|nr:Splicing factor 45 [Coemansia aciculifera]
MSLFRDLPPIESKDGVGEGESESLGAAQIGSEPAKKNVTATWVRPEFVPNLRRHRAVKPVVRRPALAAFAEYNDNGNDDRSNAEGRDNKDRRDQSSLATGGAGSTSVVKPPVPLLNSKHPHSLPQRPESLISKWEAISTAGAKPLEQPSGLGARSTALSLSLAGYMPKTLRLRGKHPGKRMHESGFEPFAEYCPAAPNDYQSYKDWAAREKKLRAEHQALSIKAKADNDEDEGDDDDYEYEDEREGLCGAAGELHRDPGEPSTCILLTNMADVVDNELELETREECAAFGEVIRCTISTIDDNDDLLSPFERVHVLVEFADLASATRAQEALDQRFFDGRHISAEFVRPEG